MAVLLPAVAALATSAAVASAGALIVEGALIAGFTFGTGIAIASGVSALAGAVAATAVSSLVTSRPSVPDFAADATLRTRQFIQPITERRWVYGRTRVSGPLAYIGTTSNGKYLHMVIVLASHESEAIDTVYFNDKPIFNDDVNGSGNVTSGTFSGKVRIKKHLGTDAQTADSDLIADVAELDSNFRLRGNTYLYVRLERDATLFPKEPNVSAIVRGKKTYDTRTSTSLWSPNSALAYRDYLTNSRWYGRGVATADINDTEITAAANVCEEFVATKSLAKTVSAVDATNDYLTLSGDILEYDYGDRVQVTTTDTLPAGISAVTNYYVIPIQEVDTLKIQLASSYANALAGTQIDITDAGTGTHTVTKNAEPRYTCNGSQTTGKTHFEAISAISVSMGGTPRHAGTQWGLLAGAWQSPGLTLDEDDILGKIKFRSKHSRRDRFNAVQGLFVSPLNKWQPVEYPVITNATYETEDGAERITAQKDLTYTARTQTAQRLAKISLERHRNQGLISFRTTLVGMLLQTGDTFNITYDRFSWSTKTFEVMEWNVLSIIEGEAPVFVVDIAARESASSIFDWNESTEESQMDAANIATFHDFTSVAAPTSLVLTSGTAVLFKKLDGTILSRIKAAWTASVDEFVVQYEIQFKKSAESTWEPSKIISSELVEDFIWDVEEGTNYDVRVRGINVRGAKSAWLTETAHTVVGKTAPPNDVTNFSAQQNGVLTTFKWAQVSDIDLSGYEIRFDAQGAFVWGNATVVTSVTKGTLVTNSAIPPGTWTLGVKAIDTSGNYSTNATTFNITITNANDVIQTVNEHPRWIGTLTNFVRHDVSGTLVPKSTDSDSTGDNFDVFDTFVLNPVSEATYEPSEIDLGFDVDGVRVWAGSAAALGPGEVTGVADVELDIDYRDEADSYDGFEWWTIGTIDARRIKYKAKIDTSTGVAFLKEFSPVADVAERNEVIKDVVIAASGTTVTYDTHGIEQFHTKPAVQITVDGGTALYPVKSNVSTTAVDINVFNDSGADVGGTVDIELTGA